MSMPWLRLYSEMIDDEKIRLLAFEDRWHYVALLCCKCSGLLDAGDAPEMLRRKLGVKLGLAKLELEAAALRLAEVGLIDQATFQPLGWGGRQFISDTDPTAAERKRRQRERQRSGMSRVTPVTVTRTDTDKETDKEEAKAIRAAAQHDAEFERWWALYPNKKGKEPARKAWIKQRLDGQSDELIRHVELMATTDRGWLQGYIPMASTYINQKRWQDEPEAGVNGNGRQGGGIGRRESEAERVERINRELDQADGGARW